MQNTNVLFHYHSAHNDKAHWDEPNVFRPERFLDERGQFCRNNSTFPFGLGKFETTRNREYSRHCLSALCRGNFTLCEGVRKVINTSCALRSHNYMYTNCENNAGDIISCFKARDTVRVNCWRVPRCSCSSPTSCIISTWKSRPITANQN